MSKYLKRIIFLAFLFYAPLLFSQLTVKVNFIPENTPQGDDIYLAGNFNNWNPGDVNYKLVKNDDGTYQVSISPTTGALEFKFTRGDWATVESNLQGGDIANRKLNYTGGQQTTNARILNWIDSGFGSETMIENVFIIDNQFYIPQFDRTRRVWIYLPPDYEDGNRSYPVLYMHDGQNLFDVHSSFGGEWGIDESLNNLIANGNKGAIVVGIDNGGGFRLDEYTPWVNLEYGGGGGSFYIDFIVETLKPYIDTHYRTKPGRLHTGIMGSSLGGLISLYAGIEHQDVFSKVGAFSPSFWFSDEAYEQVLNKGKQADMRIYLIAGGQENDQIRNGTKKMYGILQQAGFDDSELFMKIHSSGSHNEAYWRREFPDAYQWLFDNNIVSTSYLASKSNVKIYPNPFAEFVNFSHTHDIKNLNLNIYNGIGELLYSNPLAKDGEINLSHLKNGFYFFQLIQNGETVLTKKLLHLSE